MCGIVGAVSRRNIESILLHGLQCLEYRGYDSAGMAILHPDTASIQRTRIVGKVANLAEVLKLQPLTGHVGIAHTRWATHGQPTENNAHPHTSQNEIAVVHNGIIENHDTLRNELIQAGYTFTSETDTEVIGHLLHFHYQKQKNMFKAIAATTRALEGAYALGITCVHEPDRVYATRSKSPLVIGLGDNENFIASDQVALINETNQFIYLEEGDIACVQNDAVEILNAAGEHVARTIHTSTTRAQDITKGEFAHFMYKEIYEQPHALRQTLENHLTAGALHAHSFGPRAESLFSKTKRIHIIACGTSYHAGCIAKHWLESIAHIPCQVEVASEYRYREPMIESDSLCVCISQSGETADTLAALRQAKTQGHLGTLAICNVAESSLARESDLLFLTRAGSEIGVAATKTFTTQLEALLIFTIVLAQKNNVPTQRIQALTDELEHLPQCVEHVLSLDSAIQSIAKTLVDMHHALFLGRGVFFPVAQEGALKLKEISYVHAESYPAGELKHGPLALVDETMPVIVVAPNNALSDKLASNVQEVSARGGRIVIFSDEQLRWPEQPNITVLRLPSTPEHISPIVYTIPLQLLSYHVGVLKGTNVDQPRNLAKSVTVE